MATKGIVGLVFGLCGVLFALYLFWFEDWPMNIGWKTDRVVTTADSTSVVVSKSDVKEFLQSTGLNWGPANQLGDCKLWLQSDCDGGWAVFTPTRAHMIDLCTDRFWLRTGPYKLTDSTLTISLDSTEIERAYNWNSELDSTQVQYFVSQKSVAPTTYHFAIQGCTDGFVFVEASQKLGMAVSNSWKRPELIERLKDFEMQ